MEVYFARFELFLTSDPVNLNAFQYSTLFNPFQPSVLFHVETSHLLCIAKQMTGFYMKCSTRLKWVNNKEYRKVLEHM